MLGLYDRFRGPHMYWLSAISQLSNQSGGSTTLENSLNILADGLVNLVHYEDAAAAAVKALMKGIKYTTMRLNMTRKNKYYDYLACSIIKCFEML
jgi:hypothetical protein